MSQSTAELEIGLLGALLVDGERVADAREAVGIEDFLPTLHRHVARAIWALDDAQSAIDLVTVVHWLQADEEAGAHAPPKGWAAFVAEVASRAISGAHLRHYSRTIRDAVTLRLMSRALEAGAADAKGVQIAVQGAVDEFIDVVESRIHDAAHRSLRGADVGEMGEIAQRVCEDILSGEPPPGLRTGILDLDQILLGLRPQELSLIAARPSVGKTSLALQIALNVAKDSSASVLLLSLEMSQRDLTERLLSNLASIDSARIRARELDAEEAEALRAASAELAKLPIGIVDGPAWTVPRLRGLARRWRQRKGLDLVVVDYLQLLSDPRYKDRLQEVSAISRSLKALARDLNVPVIALSQLSRAGEGPDPKLSTLRESGTLEQDADVVVTLWADDREDPISVSVAKNRNGRTGYLKLAFLREFYRVGCLARSRDL